jgi:nicotinamide mononucleotide adenylyltransferase
MEYLEAAKKQCERLVVGVTNPDTKSLTFHAADPKRSKSENNPFSYFLRHEMIDSSLREAGWESASFAIVPADVTDISRVGVFLPDAAETTVFITVYDGWGEEKAKRLRDIGYRVEILWRRDMSSRFTSGTEVRRRMLQNEPWEHLVPSGVAYHLNRFNSTLALKHPHKECVAGRAHDDAGQLEARRAENGKRPL